jgi:hypothetical protein
MRPYHSLSSSRIEILLAQRGELHRILARLSSRTPVPPMWQVVVEVRRSGRRSRDDMGGREGGARGPGGSPARQKEEAGKERKGGDRKGRRTT